MRERFHTSSLPCALLLVALVVFGTGCGAGPDQGYAGVGMAIDGRDGDWQVMPAVAGDAGGARFRQAGVATAVEVVAIECDSQAVLVLFASFLGAAAEPVFVDQTLLLRDADGSVYERRFEPGGAGQAGDGLAWEVLEIDHQGGSGRARVAVETLACGVRSADADADTNRRRCQRLAGVFDVDLRVDPELRVVR